MELIRNARQLVILAGGGIIHAGARAELEELAELLDLPVTTPLMGLGGLPSRHPLSLGMPGMHDTGYANLARHNSDVIICVGCRLDDCVTGKLKAFAPQARLIHVDVDTSEIGKTLPAAVPIVGDARSVLAALIKGVLVRERRPDFSAWRKNIVTWKARYPMGCRSQDGVILLQQVVELVSGFMHDTDIVVTGVGQHQMFTAQYYEFRVQRTLISSGGLWASWASA